MKKSDPQTTPPAMELKTTRQSKENQLGTCVWCNAVGKTGRENNEACCNGNKGIKGRHGDGFSHKALIFINVAAKNFHSAHADAEGKEALVEGCIDRVPDAVLFHISKIGFEIEGNAFHGTGKEQAPDTQNDHKSQKGHHHELGYAF